MDSSAPNWHLEIKNALTWQSAARLYGHAATILSHYEQLPKLAKALRALSKEGAKLEQTRGDNDSRARLICSALGLNTKLGRLPPVARSELQAAGLPIELAEFVARNLTQAYEASINTSNPRIRARAVTAAMQLNRPVGKPANREKQTSSVVTGKFKSASPTSPVGEVETSVRTTFSTVTPDEIINAIESILELTPQEQRTVRTACIKVAEKYCRDPSWVESVYYANRNTHSKLLTLPRRKKKVLPFA